MSVPAVPDSVTIRNLKGTYVMNKTLSDDFGPILTLQEVGWIVRQAAKYSSVSIKVEQADNEDGVNRVNIIQTSSGGIRSTEERTMDWTWREKKDNIFGLVKGRSRFCKLDEIKDEWLKADLDPKSLEAGGNEFVNSITESVDLAGDQWSADQVWGFEVIEDVRRHVRRILFTRGSEVHKVKTVYDWKEE